MAPLPVQVVNFLAVTAAWDPSLAFVMGAACLVCMPSFKWITMTKKNPLLDKVGFCSQHDDCYLFSIPTNKTIDLKLIVGGWLFGLGWGISGLCPGPAVLLAATGHPKVFAAFLPGMLLGMSTLVGIQSARTWRHEAVAQQPEPHKGASEYPASESPASTSSARPAKRAQTAADVELVPCDSC